MYTSFWDELNVLTKVDSAASCCGCPPAPSPTNQLTTTPPLGPGPAAIGAGVMAGGADAEATATGAVEAVADGDGDADALHAVAIMTTKAPITRTLCGAVPERFIALLSSSSRSRSISTS